MSLLSYILATRLKVKLDHSVRIKHGDHRGVEDFTVSKNPHKNPSAKDAARLTNHVLDPDAVSFDIGRTTTEY